ncbi:MAG: RNA polymerase sigma factor for flagellar operon FliA [Acidimicrobiales bacterium]|jgi:RNA polymerase sigma factor for flagellar operon FliA
MAIMLRTKTPSKQGNEATPRTSPASAKSTVALTPEEEAIVEKNLPLVNHIVGRVTEFFPASDNEDDLIQAGVIGLIEATRRFDPDLGFAYSTFVGRRIEGAVRDHLRNMDWVPRSVRRKERLLHQTEAELTASLGRAPTDAELCSAMEIERVQLHKLRADMDRTRLEYIFEWGRPSDGNSREAELPELVAERGPGTDDLEHTELMSYLREGLELLPPRHRTVIVGHFLEGRSMTELGEFLGVTQSRASQLKSDALEMLRQGLEASWANEGGDDAGRSTENLDNPSKRAVKGVAGDNLRSNENTDRPEPSKRQQAYNEALTSASTWQDRLERGHVVAAI